LADEQHLRVRMSGQDARHRLQQEAVALARNELRHHDEYRNAVEVLGLGLPELWAVDRHALDVAFLHDDEPLRDALRAAFDGWAAGEPLVRP
ncbi:MAG: hypothetical protein M0Z49_04195, partial [Chloroflexi bacterium]|nr:hypothetical protein [Chloroflexota bacterium]